MHRTLRDAMERRIHDELERESARLRAEEETRIAHEKLLSTLPKGWKVHRRRPEKGEVSVNVSISFVFAHMLNISPLFYLYSV